ncbi:hypothetical protein [Streptomyces sp. NRRL S-118]|uniref:hypothetical protein n=1 Tax=Streptomyces sp. NRRL S-118 TaxID=1463881 RepID=UPI0004C90BE2|nr:hypothetical protein [Streptomyces sp. NRRL S-118]
MGYVVGTVWFAFLAASGDERPTWLRIGYAVTAAVFAGGAVATSVIGLRKRSGRAAKAADEPAT